MTNTEYQQHGLPTTDGARLTASQRRRVDYAMSEVLGNHDKPPAVTGWTRFTHQVDVDAQVTHGQPRFPHLLHAIMTIMTGGFWGLVWWAHWMGSARRRYQRSRRAALAEAGLLDPANLFVPGVPGTKLPRR